ncbi:AsmA-like C-terminal domain-containing protein, partial [Alphaproteobacteria bacterium]|nr:AsmA-like C-terminal domain-containing protein [Alphaproteobacteria bacterium]
LTADEIVLYPKVSISGNLKGSLKKSILECTAFGKMKLGNLSLLDAGKLKIFVSEKIAKLDGIGLTGGAETKINLLKRKNKFPQITFDTSDGGKLLNALDFTSNVRSGEMKINVKFLNKFYNEYEGNIKSKKFSLINTPGIIKSLSVLSFSGIQSIISGEGVSFDNGQAKIYFKDKMFNFDKVYLSSESLGLAARGKLNLENDTIDLRGSIAPIKLISRIISVVPAIGELITGLKKEGLFAGQFKMTGSTRDPKVKLNTLSFAPGILREIFSEDWLDQDNFFVKNKLN